MKLAGLVLLVILLGVVPAAADDNPADEPKPLTPEQAADKVLKAFKSKDEAALEALAAKDEPDPWLVTDELCYRGEQDAAEAFAGAASRPAVAKLAAYVVRRRERNVEHDRRGVLDVIDRLLKAEQWERVLTTAGSGGASLDSVPRIRIAFARATALRRVPRLADAATAYLHVAVACRDLGWFEKALDAFHESANASYDDDDLDAALSGWQARLALAKEIDDRKGTAGALCCVGLVYDTAGRYDLAQEYYERSVALYTSIGDEGGVASTLNNLGSLYVTRGELAQALTMYRRALALKEKLGDEAATAPTLLNIGNIHQYEGRLREALDVYRRVLDLTERHDMKFGKALVLNAIGAVHTQRKDYRQAIVYMQRALELHQARGNRRGAAIAQRNIAQNHFVLGQYAEALDGYERILGIAVTLSDRKLARTIHAMLGTLYQTIGRYPEALDQHRRALEIDQALDNPRALTETLLNIGSVLSMIPRYEESLRVLQQALDRAVAADDHEFVSSALNAIGGVHADLGQPREALRHYREAVDESRRAADRRGLAIALTNVGLIEHESGNFGEAILARREAYELLDEASDPIVRAHACSALAGTIMTQAANKEALVLSHEAVDIALTIVRSLGEAEAAQARSRWADIFEVGAVAARNSGDVAEMAFFLESGRAGTLLESLKARDVLHAALIPVELRAEEAELHERERRAVAAYRDATATGQLKRVRSARKDLESARDAIQTLTTHMQRRAKTGAAIAYPQPDDLPTLQAHLGPREALVLFSLTTEGADALVVTRKGARIVRLGSQTELLAACDALLAGGNLKVAVEHVAALRTRVVEPLKLGSQVQRVLVSPVDRLGYVPFALLMPDQEVVYVPSGTTYGRLLEARGKRGRGVLALGDPDYGVPYDPKAAAAVRSGLNLVSLPATADEAKAVGDRVLLGREATESGLSKAAGGRARWRAVHLACHGLIDAERPMFSSLALTPGDGEDGLLTVLEVFGMKMPADLVVLSACDTGKGKVYRAEGIIGLTRAFMYAGAPRVICSLWKVDDEATQALMIKFYELWNPKDGTQGLGAAAALKKAQEYVRDHPDHPKWKHPYYWAAWVLWGLPR